MKTLRRLLKNFAFTAGLLLTLLLVVAALAAPGRAVKRRIVRALFRDRTIGEGTSEHTRRSCSTADTEKGRSMFTLVRAERRRRNRVARASRRVNRGAYRGR